ncbi:MAG: DUF2330 domain-containing protein [Candidatus Nomurabacteria bacterium]|nr:DUF2330 domain-containing protein [Candidatus Nomurabacteria bacterium]
MRKTGHKRVLACLFVLAVMVAQFFVAALPAEACGCGVLVENSNKSAGWSYGQDADEVGYINYHDGTEEMIIALDIKDRSNNAALIVPVPAKPNSITPDVLTETPTFYGKNIKEEARSFSLGLGKSLATTQSILLFLSDFAISTVSTSISDYDGITAPTTKSAADYNVRVYNHIEVNGMVAEVVTAEYASGLYDYLKSMGLNTPSSGIPVLQDYIGEDYSFLISWIAAGSKNDAAAGLYASFPTERIYYPLMPGSAYAEGNSSQTIYVAGLVSPKIYHDISSSTEVEYFTTGNDVSRTARMNDGEEEKRRITLGYDKSNHNNRAGFKLASREDFTTININAAPDQLTEDLWIDDSAPANVFILGGVLNGLSSLSSGGNWVIFVILWLVVTTVTTYISTAIFKKRTGLWNSPKMIGVVLLGGLTFFGTLMSTFIIFGRRVKFWQMIGYFFLYKAVFVLLGFVPFLMACLLAL